MKQTDNITRELNEIQRMFAQFGVKHKTILKTAKTVGAGKGGTVLIGQIRARRLRTPSSWVKSVRAVPMESP